MEYYQIYHLTGWLGNLTVTEKDNALSGVSFGNYISENAINNKAINSKAVNNKAVNNKAVNNKAVNKETPLLKEAALQLKEYLEGSRREFTLPLAPQGTPFMQKVWAALRTIPYGETRSYQEIAVQIGDAKACRAVGNANNRNPIGIIIPCHRVIGKNGSLTGYAGGLNIKEQLLHLERSN